MSESSKKLGENLKRIRTEKQVTQTKLADLLNVDKSFLSNVENGKTNPTLSTIAKLATALNVSIEELIK